MRVAALKSLMVTGNSVIHSCTKNCMFTLDGEVRGSSVVSTDHTITTKYRNYFEKLHEHFHIPTLNEPSLQCLELCSFKFCFSSPHHTG